ncbi:MAG: permease-like cell division protein FtsX [Chloroflexota bacterium]|nr:permease-like cell division protein FtsX [Chloroflexota bacterium]
MARLHVARYLLGSAFTGLWRNRTMTGGAIVTTAIMLITLAGFLAINDTLNQMVTALGRKSNLIAYVRDEARPTQVTAIIDDLRTRPGVGEVQFVSKEDALAIFESRFVDQRDILDVLQSNPLPASVELRLNNPAVVPELAQELQAMTAVFDDVVVPLDVVEEVIGISNLARVAGSVIIIALTGVTLFVIVNTIRIAVFARRQEIEIMKLVGATDWFVRGPFVAEGAIIGGIGAGIAAIALVVLYAQAAPVVTRIVSFLPVSTDTDFVRNLAVFTLLVGLIVGSLGSYFSVRRYLSV